MTDKLKKSDYKATKKPFRIFSYGRLLLLFLLISVAQYSSTGSVSWLTDSFRWIDVTARSVAGNPRGSLEPAEEAFHDVAKRTGGTASSADTDITNSPGSKAEISWSEPTYDLSGRVSRIADGDTITIVDSKGAKHKIRLFGIDSPEYDQPYYADAKQAITRLVGGKSVGVEVKDRDTYGRVVGVVHVNGRNVNLEMVRAGYAWWYKHYAPSDKKLRDGEAQARAARRGLWQQKTPVPPWEWRRKHR